MRYQSENAENFNTSATSCQGTPTLCGGRSGLENVSGILSKERRAKACDSRMCKEHLCHSEQILLLVLQEMAMLVITSLHQDLATLWRAESELRQDCLQNTLIIKHPCVSDI